MNLIHTATLMAFLISFIAGCSTQYPHEPLRPIQFGALFLIGLVVFVWLLLILKNTKTDIPNPRDRCDYYYVGHSENGYIFMYVLNRTSKVWGQVNRRPLNGDVLLRHDTKGQEHSYVMTNVKWDEFDGMRFTADITPWEES